MHIPFFSALLLRFFHVLSSSPFRLFQLFALFMQPSPLGTGHHDRIILRYAFCHLSRKDLKNGRRKTGKIGHQNIQKV